MSAPASVEELLQLIRKSGMVDEGKLTSYLQRRQKGRGIPTDPREAAEGMVTDGIITNFQSEQFLLGKWRGFTIGKFKLLERVGVGGMGQVFLCEHMFMKRRVAIKVLPPAKAEQPAALGRFYREARAAGILEHPNIVRTHDIDQDGNLHFIVMEYVDGSNMLEIVKKFGPMNIDRAVGYVKQVAGGLDFAFRSGIIHRDVKPGNILIDRKGNARVLDMGLARFFKDTSDMLTVKYDDKIVLGTADYVAPEQVANSHGVDVRADVYALGATLYFLLAGHPPFPTGTVSQKLLWHRTKEPTAIRQIRPEVSEELAAVLVKMMAKDPNARYQSPGEVLQALTAFAPATLPIPPAAEMPILCLAVTEGAEQVVDLVPQTPAVLENPARIPAMAGVGAGSGVTSAEARHRQLANPFGPAPSAPAAFSPLPPTGGSRLTKLGTGSAHAIPRLEPAPAYHPSRPHDATPLPGTVPLPTADAWKESQPTARPSTIQKIALYLILAASVAVGGSIIYLKFVKPRFVDNTPAVSTMPN
ncbi:serine/threonine protein kinase [Limnoglobus roseus]|uniref:Serine/threonine protein kinase n=1 Tax=Limnoglobus roseus TaxID=2598579 RepID=A0A5C1A623_9BACT|nr:serine/threonine-protein kinase [Limnoglobus roseus]QEL13282.1 serine/threonine protein kinase [Limnoglobus roseus]